MDQEQLIEKINRAFATVPVPAKDSITGCTCGECMEIRESFAGKQPEELEEKRMRFHSWDMGFFTPEARQYYLPGWMRLGLTLPTFAYADAVVEILKRDDGWEPVDGYTENQKNSISEFLQLIRIRNDDCYDSDFKVAWDRWVLQPEADLSEQESEASK
ncbi:hypothetical protein BH11VER1_BH11VER1_30280 [soil metagenome]